MIYEMVKPESGILDGCFEGHFVISANKKGETECFVLQMNLEDPCVDYSEGINFFEKEKFKLHKFSNKQCLVNNLGYIGRQTLYKASRERFPSWVRAN